MDINRTFKIYLFPPSLSLGHKSSTRGAYWFQRYYDICYVRENVFFIVSHSHLWWFAEIFSGISRLNYVLGIFDAIFASEHSLFYIFLINEGKKRNFYKFSKKFVSKRKKDWDIVKKKLQMKGNFDRLPNFSFIESTFLSIKKFFKKKKWKYFTFFFSKSKKLQKYFKNRKKCKISLKNNLKN